VISKDGFYPNVLDLASEFYCKLIPNRTNNNDTYVYHISNKASAFQLLRMLSLV